MNPLCQRLNLTSLVRELPRLVEAARQQQLSYEAFLQSVLTAELAGRQQRAQARRVRAARLPFPARLEAFDFRFQPSVSQRLIHELASLAFLQTATNVVFLGPPGVGKTHLACGLAQTALEAGHSALFVSLRELSQQLDAPAPRGGLAALRRYSQPTLLIIDEIGYTRLNPTQAQALFELVTTRYERRSTVLTSNLTFAEWGGLLGDEVLATALLDRLLHHAEVVTINGRSYRMRQRLPADLPAANP
ncbi:MAG: IS21-like element helper ATPase IstB [Chloroflexota bacterium]|nr:IS21-like element helper ATPase IstB [Chloroflexota bacterium]